MGHENLVSPLIRNHAWWSIVVVVGLIATQVMAAPHATADPCDEYTVSAGCEDSDDGSPDVPPPTDPDVTTPVRGGGDGQPEWSCTSVDDPDRYQVAEVMDDMSIWAYRLFTCTAAGFPDNVFSRMVCVYNCPPGTPPVDVPPVITPEDVRGDAYAEVVPVAPSFSIEPDTPVVGIPTFLHVPDAAQRQATDTGGGFTVVVTATLAEVRWTLGDDDRTCSTGGAPFTEARLGQALAQPDGLVDDGTICTFLFIDSSNRSHGGDLPASVQTVWDYSWSVNGSDRGVFNSGVTSPAATFALDVREYQAVLTE